MSKVPVGGKQARRRSRRHVVAVTTVIIVAKLCNNVSKFDTTLINKHAVGEG